MNTIEQAKQKTYSLGTPKPNNLRQLRQSKNITVKQAAEHIDVKIQAIHRMETNGTGLGPAKVKRLAEFYGVNAQELVVSIFFPEISPK
jgi:transcriptional regulator with XRE-family HTH domain